MSIYLMMSIYQLNPMVIIPNLNYDDFFKWYKDVDGELTKIEQVVINRDSINDSDRDNAVNSALNIFYHFQSYCYLFRKTNIEIITLRNIFSKIKNVILLAVEMSSDPIDRLKISNFGSVVNKQHESILNETIKTIASQKSQTILSANQLSYELWVKLDNDIENQKSALKMANFQSRFDSSIKELCSNKFQKLNSFFNQTYLGREIKNKIFEFGIKTFNMI